MYTKMRGYQCQATEVASIRKEGYEWPLGSFKPCQVPMLSLFLKPVSFKSHPTVIPTARRLWVGTNVERSA